MNENLGQLSGSFVKTTRSKSIPELKKLISYTKSRIMAKLVFKEESDGISDEHLDLQSTATLSTNSESNKSTVVNRSVSKSRKRTSTPVTLSDSTKQLSDQMAIGSQAVRTIDSKLINKATASSIKSKSNRTSTANSIQSNEPINSQPNLNNSFKRHQSVPLVSKNDSLCFCSYF